MFTGFSGAADGPTPWKRLALYVVAHIVHSVPWVQRWGIPAGSPQQWSDWPHARQALLLVVVLVVVVVVIVVVVVLWSRL